MPSMNAMDNGNRPRMRRAMPMAFHVQTGGTAEDKKAESLPASLLQPHKELSP